MLPLLRVTVFWLLFVVRLLNFILLLKLFLVSIGLMAFQGRIVSFANLKVIKKDFQVSRVQRLTLGRTHCLISSESLLGLGTTFRAY